MGSSLQEDSLAVVLLRESKAAERWEDTRRRTLLADAPLPRLQFVRY